jgi:hypothetical protein
MAHTLTLSDDGSTLTARFSRVIEYAEIEQVGLDRLAYPGVENIPVWVTDFADAELGDVSAEDVQRDVVLAGRIAEELPELVVVAIMSDQFAYGMARMWQGLAGDQPPVSAHVVRTREEAATLVNEILVGGAAS